MYERDYIRRNVVYIFNWGREPFSEYFITNIHYVMKVYAITNPRNDTFRIFYNQALPPHENHHFKMVNWWRDGVGLFNHPTLPSTYNNAFKDFKGYVFKVPVINVSSTLKQKQNEFLACRNPPGTSWTTRTRPSK